MYLMTFQIITIGILKYADSSGIRRLFNYNVSKIHISYLHTTTKCHASTSHPGVSSPQLLHQGENFTLVGNLATVSCKRETTRDFGGKSVCWWTGMGSACLMVAILNHTYILLT